MNKISLQTKLILLILFLIALPIGFAAHILLNNEEMFKSRKVISALTTLSEKTQKLGSSPNISLLERSSIQDYVITGDELPHELNRRKELEIKKAREQLEQRAQNAESINDYLKSNNKLLLSIDTSIARLESYSKLFWIITFVYIVLALLLMSAFISRTTAPMKSIFSELKAFQNESHEDHIQPDLLECAFSFENFLNIAKTILSETFSIAQELSRQLESISESTFFSPDNLSEYAEDIQVIAESSSYVSNTLDSTSLHINDISSSATTIAERSIEAADGSTEAASTASDGKNAVSETIEYMEAIKDEVFVLEEAIKDLDATSKQISEIVSTISNISHQTNLLALNAAIEAARAGEHGQGFTVVAGEVRKLAEESEEAAEDIDKKIKQVLAKTSQSVEAINHGTEKVTMGVKLANLAGESLNKIVSSVLNVNKMIQEISDASTEQSTNIDSLKGNIQTISNATKDTSEKCRKAVVSVEEQVRQLKHFAQVTTEMNTLINLLSAMLDKFNLR